ncbi:probable serine/threonine-protein kinase cdc7 isoform X2 [Spodoptera litura]|uniref:non-specific serine/threonine protein kinase n=1 Tax=Spodoptera litura TaxID=69820 RepID=A0A9J7ENC3_SPOLT|nr:probable serine/threonine-protein kinase cdc7 isoform X2 [Spodoptera litura]
MRSDGSLSNTWYPLHIQLELNMNCAVYRILGKEHVIGVELCLRNLDTIVFIMPYIPHRKFSEYVGEMDATELRQYMRALMVALRHVHSFGVIHRDVKPSNFLYDRDNKRYLLVDFGLAQRLCPAPEGTPMIGPPPAHSNGVRKRTRDEEDGPAAKRVALDLSMGSPAATGTATIAAAGPEVAAAEPRPGAAGSRPGATGSRPGMSGPRPGTVGSKPGAVGPRPGRCPCAGVAGVCDMCSGRAAPRAPRAGTQGFRPPEVLLKYPHQTTAVDVWAAGVVLASALTARYPFFRASDDVAALAELADLVGTEPLQRAAASLGRRVVSSSARRGVCLRALAARLRGEPLRRAPCVCRREFCLCPDRIKKAEEWDPRRSVAGFPDSAFSLAARLLDPDPRTRISAHDALAHPFLAAAD